MFQLTLQHAAENGVACAGERRRGFEADGVGQASTGFRVADDILGKGAIDSNANDSIAFAAVLAEILWALAITADVAEVAV